MAFRLHRTAHLARGNIFHQQLANPLRRTEEYSAHLADGVGSGALADRFSIVLRIAAALMPVAMLTVSKMIIDRVVAVVSTHKPASPDIWWLLGLEFVLACPTTFWVA